MWLFQNGKTGHNRVKKTEKNREKAKDDIFSDLALNIQDILAPT